MPSYAPPPMLNGGMPDNWMMHGNANRPAPYSEASGSYQLPDGSWHQASLIIFDGQHVTAKDGVAGKHRFTAEALQQLVVAKDTFVVMRNLPGQQEALSKSYFLHSCVNSQGVRLLGLYFGVFHPTYFLSLPHTSLRLLPTAKPQLKTAMLAIVKESPVLSEKVASGALGRDEVVQTISEYTDFIRLSKLTKQ